MSKSKGKSEKAEKAVKELGKKMCGYVRDTLDHIREHNPELAVLIREMD
jgi:hypothetical protein